MGKLADVTGITFLGPASQANPLRGNVFSDAADNWVSSGTQQIPGPSVPSITQDYAHSVLRPYGDTDTAASMAGVKRRPAGAPRPPIVAASASNANMRTGAPADFPGVVIPNPNGLIPRADTDPPPATRLPNGIAFNRGNFQGRMGANISNPPRAQLIPRGKRSF